MNAFNESANFELPSQLDFSTVEQDSGNPICFTVPSVEAAESVSDGLIPDESHTSTASKESITSTANVPAQVFAETSVVNVDGGEVTGGRENDSAKKSSWADFGSFE